jgi:glutaredoxin
MGPMEKVVVYSTANCPKCEKLKTGLRGLEYEFIEMDMTSKEALTELRFNGVFTVNAPVLQVGEDFFTEDQIFTGDESKNEVFSSNRGGWK